MPGHRADHGTAKHPESLRLISALPLSGRRAPSPARTLLPGHGSYGLIRQSPPAPLSFGLSLVRGVSAGCYQPLLPAGPSRRFSVNPSLGAWAPVTAVPRTAHACFSSTSSAFPRTLSRSASRVSRQNDFLTDRPFRDCSHFFMFRPPSLLASPIVPTAATQRRRAAEAFTSEQNMLRFLCMHRTC